MCRLLHNVFLPANYRKMSRRPQSHAVSSGSVLPSLIDRLNDDYDNLILALREEKAAQDRDIAEAWTEIERERELIRREWQRVEEEKARLFTSHDPRAASMYRGSVENVRAGLLSNADQPVSIMRSSGPNSPPKGRRSPSPGPRSGSPASERRHYGSSAHGLQSTLRFDEMYNAHGNVINTGPGTANCIFVWSGVSRAASPHRLVLGHFRTMRQLLERAGIETQTQPVGEQMYTPDGTSVTRLEEVVPGQDYLVLPSGCRYREDSVPSQLLRKLVDANPLVTHMTL
jgi:hypothetical protein